HEPPGHGGDVLVPQRPVDVEGGVGAEHGDRGGQLVEGLATALVGGTPVVHRGEVAREVPDPGPGVALGGGGDEVDVDDHAGGHLGAEAATRPVGAGQRRHRGGHAVVGQDGGDGDEVDAGAAGGQLGHVDRLAAADAHDERRRRLVEVVQQPGGVAQRAGEAGPHLSVAADGLDRLGQALAVGAGDVAAGGDDDAADVEVLD